uniref:DUF4371 domain-containing protein n=1 Tax=Kalanchoe fedtschenkoi TaxID=63787 RepID=A0A7N0TC16_KALFE
MYKYYRRKTSEPATSTNVVNSLNIGEPQVDLESLPTDPGLRRKLSEYHLNIRDEVRRAYLLEGPCQPIKHKFPQRDIGGANGESFVGKGFNSWSKQDRLDMHIGGPASAHNLALQKCKDLMKREQHIDVVMHKRSDKAICDYCTRLLASIDCVRFLLCQGLSFRGHDESESSSNKGNFLKLLKFLANHNESIDNVHLLFRRIFQMLAAQEVVSTIIKDIDGDYFAILIDESRDISIKEQMAVAVRYVNKRGEIIGRVIGIVHVSDTTAFFYVHCFAHQLQLTLVAIAKNHDEVASLFYFIGILTGVVEASCNRQDMLRGEQAKIIRKAMEDGELVIGRGLN